MLASKNNHKSQNENKNPSEKISDQDDEGNIFEFRPIFLLFV